MPECDKSPRNRRSIRLRDYDYRQRGAYFVTVCTRQKTCLFGEIRNGKLIPNELGIIVQNAWHQIPNKRSNVDLDSFVIMPNHLHGIILMLENCDLKSSIQTLHFPARCSALQSGSLGAIIGQFKAAVTRRSKLSSRCPSSPIWQRNYYEHIIRNDKSLNFIRAYIVENPARWNDDELHLK